VARRPFKKKPHPEESGRVVFKHEKNLQKASLLLSRRFGYKNGPNDFVY